MAGRGPAGKGVRSRDRDTPEFAEVVDDGVLHGPELPAEGGPWHPMTLAWWDSLRRFPAMASEPDVGWAFLFDTAFLHSLMWSDEEVKLAAEIRLRVAKFGVTPEDRMRLKIKVLSPSDVPADAAAAAGVTDIASRRDRLSS